MQFRFVAGDHHLSLVVCAPLRVLVIDLCVLPIIWINWVIVGNCGENSRELIGWILILEVMCELCVLWTTNIKIFLPISPFSVVLNWIIVKLAVQKKLATVADAKKSRRCTPSPIPASVPGATELPQSMTMGPTTAAPFLTWSPILLPPWGPAFLPAAFYPSALRSALPG